MTIPIVLVTIDYKGFGISLIDDSIEIDGVKTDIDKIKLAQSARIEIYNEAMKQLKVIATKGNYFNNLSFTECVSRCKSLKAIRHTLVRLRLIGVNNGSYLHRYIKTNTDKTIEDIFFNGNISNSFSLPEKSVLYEVSNSLIGNKLSIWDIPYNVIQNDISEFNNISCAYRQFDFNYYFGINSGLYITADADQVFRTFTSNVATFNQYRRIAGKDIVNWGSHKYAAVSKKHNLERNWQIEHWGQQLADYYKKQGIQVKEKRISPITILKKKFQDNKDSLTQNEYVSLFKTSSESNAYVYLRFMDIDTLVSLLQIPTKNVRAKLLGSFRPTALLNYIEQQIADKGNRHHFLELKYFNYVSTYNVISWKCLFKFVDHYTIDEFIACLEKAKYIEFNEQYNKQITEDFYNKVIINLPEEKKLLLHPYITHEIITRMSNEEKENFLFTYRNYHEVIRRFDPQSKKESAFIDWRKTASLFYSLDKKVIMDALNNLSCSRYFIDWQF